MGPGSRPFSGLSSGLRGYINVELWAHQNLVAYWTRASICFSLEGEMEGKPLGSRATCHADGG